MKNIIMIVLSCLLLTGCNEHTVDVGWSVNCPADSVTVEDCVEVDTEPAA